MSIMNPESAMKALEDGTVTSIKQYFPMDGRLNRIEATNVYVGKDADTEDTAGQKRARMGGRSWSTGVYGDFRVVDKQTGKVLTEQKGLKIANLPKITRRFSFIVDGKEYQADHQWRLKSGVYARQRDNGELESQFNLSKGRGFRLDFLPQKSQFLMRYGTTNIQLLPVLRALGKSDEDLKHEFGTAVFARLNAGKSRGDMQKLAKVLDPKYVGTTDEDATKAVKQQFDLTELRTDTTAITLGKPYSKIDADTLVASAKKLVNINRGVDEPDNRDALQFKELWSIEDHIPERITNSKGRVLAKLRNNVDRPGASVRDIIPMDTFNVPIKAYFTSTSLTQQPNQNNPIDMLGGFSRTTILGPGGISSEQSVTMNAKMIDPSTLGVLDPVHTPEGSNTGITAHLTLGVSKRGKEVVVKVYDVRHKKYVDKTPAELATGIVGFADQFEELGGKLSPRSDMVTALPKGGGDPIRVAPNEVDFVMRSPKSMFSTTSNLIPFLPSDQAGRAGMAARHMEQSVPLLQREAPLVQVASGAEDPHFDTFEKMYGAFSAHSAPVSGTVLKVSKDEIVIQGADKQKHSVGMYDHFPLNEKTAFVDSEPLVSVGDKVDKGDIIADTTATKNGTLALGINMRIGYLPWHGMNFEDGIVISESASKKLTSVHLHKPRVYLEKGMQVNLQKYRANFPGKLTDENVKKLDENGVIRKGQEVAPGDILMTVLKKTEPSAEQVMLKGIHKALSRPYRDSSVVWEGGTKGVVTDVAHNGSELVVYVKTEEPSDVGDKFCFTPDHQILTQHGWVPVAEVTATDIAAALDPVTNEITYVPVTATHTFTCSDEPLYTLETTQVSMRVTKEHKVWAQPRDKGYGLHTAATLSGTRYRLQQDGQWGGTDAPPVVVFPAMEVRAGQGGVGARMLPEIQMATDTYLMLLGMFLSEGSTYANAGNGDYYVEIAQYKPEGARRMYAALAAAGIDHVVCTGKARINSKQLWQHFHAFGLSYEKYIPRWVFELPPQQLHILYEWLMWGDGCRTGSTHVYTTTSRQLADDVQQLLLHIGSAGRVVLRPAHTATIKGKSIHMRDCYKVQVIRTKLRPTINHGHSARQSGQAEGYTYYTGSVHCVTLARHHILYVRRNGKVHWSGNSFRHGNKGVCSVVVPDEEMPKNADGVPLEVILAPDGVPGRINPGQVFETMLGKAAQKTGTTYAVDNFQSDNQHKIVHVHGFYRNIRDGHGGKKKVWVKPYDRDMGYQDIVKDALKETGTPDTEELFDPATGKSFGQVMVGTQYMIKLMHQVEKKLAARSYGYGNEYDATLAPKGGGDSGAQRFGELGTYAMLAHGATANVRDALSYKSDKAQSDVWTAIQTGEPMPAPKTSFAYDKFVAYLNAVGLNVERDGNEMRLVPLTDQQVLAKSNGALTDASKVLRGKDLKPEPGGLFDAKITGGPGGKNFSHIKLTEPLPNPVFEKAITQLLGLTGKQFDDIMAGNTKLGDKTGPAAIVQALSEIDVDKEFAASEAALKTARHSQFDRTYKRYKYLKALKAGNLTAKQAYVQSVIPVIPPVFRPIGLLEGGNLNVDGVNLLYRDLAMMNQKLEESKSLPENLVAPIRQNMYGALESLAGANTLMPGKGGEVKPPGILDVLSGSAPKHSYVHTRLLDRRQDLTMRSVITPDQSLDLNQLGVPREGAFEIFKPFIVKELVNMGYTPLAARDEIEKRTSLANRALEVAVSKRPVLFKRDPVLHKFGIMAFNVKLHDGKALQIHPLVVGGFNADFDGDTMSVFVPVSDAAVAEARKMLPSENLFDTSTGRAMYQPGLAGQLGLYLMTQMGDETKKSFASAQSAVDAAKSGDIKMTDVISVGGKRTTAGRLQVYAAIPENARTDDVLTDRNLTMEKKGLQRVMQAMATKTPKEYPHAINRLKNLGFGYAHDIGFSYEAKDFDTLHVLRAEVLKGADKSALAVRKRADLSDKQKDDKLVEIYSAATAEMNKRAKPMLEAKGSKLYMMNKAGVKPSWEQVQQMVLAPMLLNNAAGRTIPSPVTKSYSEGLDSAGYWVASSGARKGAVEKVQSVQKPGALSKQIVNAVVPYSITTNDCGTNDGIALDVKDTDLLDRYTAKTIVAGHHTFPAGTVITPNVLDQLQHAKISKVVARSALKCTAPHGLCSKCYGIMPGGNPPEVGTNVGVMAGQAFGERGTQLALKEFHTGGVAGAGSKVGSNLDRVIELLKMPETLPNAATLATTTGKVTSAVKNPLGGFDVKVGEVPHYIGGGRELLVKSGDEVGKGDKLSTGSVDPRELMDLTNVDRVQRYMTDELHGAYASEGIRRRNAEVIVKALTNLGTVDDAGDSDEFVKGDPVSLNYVAHQNKQLKNPTQVTPYLRGLETLPLDRSTDWLARLQYRHLKDTFKRGASEGWKSDLHGTSPMPGLVYGAEFGKKSPDEKGPY